MARRLSAKALAATAAQAATPFQPEGEGPPTVKPVPVDLLVRHPRNARVIPPTAEQTKLLQASVRATGVLVPILVSPIGDGKLGVVAGLYLRIGEAWRYAVEYVTDTGALHESWLRSDEIASPNVKLPQGAPIAPPKATPARKR